MEKVADLMRKGIAKTEKRSNTFFELDKENNVVKACAVGAILVGFKNTTAYHAVARFEGDKIRKEIPFLSSRIKDYPPELLPDLDPALFYHITTSDRSYIDKNKPITHLIYDLNDCLKWCRKDIANLLDELEDYYNENLKN